MTKANFHTVVIVHFKILDLLQINYENKGKSEKNIFSILS